jgi:membrane fusion protein (multidrug efflux system)
MNDPLALLRPLRPALATLAILFAPLLAASGAQAQNPNNAPPPSVTVAPVVVKDVSPSWEFIGRAEAEQAVDVRAREQGTLQEVDFAEGQDVKAGQLLFVIEPAPFDAALKAAQAQLAKAQATLQQAERNFQRFKELRERNVESQANLDQAKAQRDAAAADVEAAEANVQTAQINLGYTRIESPIDGRIGRAAITKGNLVGPDAGSLARVVQLDPIRIVYSVDDRALTAAKQKAGDLTQAEINAKFVPQIRLASGDIYGEPGKVDFIDNEVDPNTGTVAVRAVFPNPRRLLLPGQFVTVVIHPEETARRPVVPVAAVEEDRQGKYVLLVGPDNRVEQRRITADRQVDQEWVVENGLREGETVIVQGLQKVRPGIAVNPVPAQPQTAEADKAPPPGAPQPNR